jgi:hypothetical protein
MLKQFNEAEPWLLLRKFFEIMRVPETYVLAVWPCQSLSIHYWAVFVAFGHVT